MDDDQLLRVIGRIYDGAAEPSALTCLASEFAREFDSESGFLYTVLKPGAVNKDMLSATANFDDWAHTSYTRYYRQRDEWSQRAVRKVPPLIVLTEELVDKTNLLRSEIYADYWRKLGIFHALAGMFALGGDKLGVMVVHRPRRTDDFGEADRRRLGILVPHVQRAVQIHQRLHASAQSQALTIEVLDRLAFGVMVADADGRLIFANIVAQRTLRSGEGLTTSRGCLRSQHPQQRSKLEKAVREAALTSAGRGTSPGGLVVIARPSGAPLPVLVSPFRALASGYGPALPAALVLFSDPQAEMQMPADVLRQIFGLAPAEARLLSALIEGQTIAEHADAAGITLNTAKTQLRQIFFKTGHNRQADLIRAALADPLFRLAGARNRLNGTGG